MLIDPAFEQIIGMLPLRRPLLILAFAAPLASAFRINAAPPTIAVTALAASSSEAEEPCACARRRDALRRTGAAIFSGLFAAAAGPAGADVIRSPGRCANGEGEGCDDLAGDNELIRSLQRRSSDNREANQREALNAYYMKNYPDVFAVSDKRMVKKADGSFALYSTEEVAKLTQEGRIKIEYPTSKGGRIADLTQKPVLVLI